MAMNAWKLLLDHYKTQQALADAIGVRQPSISARLKKDTAVPAEWAVAVHRDSGIPLSQIRPDLWPESA